jgi:hypothetical protein
MEIITSRLVSIKGEHPDDITDDDPLTLGRGKYNYSKWNLH